MAKWKVEGKTFLVTGGAAGLGAAYTEAVLKDGAKSVAIFDIAEEARKAKAESLNKTYGDKVVFIKCDVRKEEDIVKAFDAVVARFKQVDVLVNNAGIFDDSPGMWRTSCEVNWEGVVSFSLKGIKHMRIDEGGVGGTIINISSAAGLVRFPLTPVYCDSKLAVLHFTQCVAMPPFQENTGIRMLTLCPGPTDTPILRGLEKRCYESKRGLEMVDSLGPQGFGPQKINSVLNEFMHILKNGAPGSIWLVVNDRPVLDITTTVVDAFMKFEELMK